MSKEDSNRIFERFSEREELISEAVTKDDDVEVTTRVFNDRVEVIKRSSEGGLEVEIRATSMGAPR